MRRRLLVALPLALLVVGLAGYCLRDQCRTYWRLHRGPSLSMEQQAREYFLRRHPGEKPLNYRIGQAAEAFYKARPMGKFVLCITVPDVGNDCSDFVACAVDEGVGARARFKRHSSRHLVAQDPHYFESFMWDRQTPLLPGDSVAVAHSPWYAPYEGACWHVGVIGSDGMVYDFVKLKRWQEARYGRHAVDWFVHNVHTPREIAITRVRPEYRYLLEKIPIPAEVPAPTRPTAPTRSSNGTEGS